MCVYVCHHLLFPDLNETLKDDWSDLSCKSRVWSFKMTQRHTQIQMKLDMLAWKPISMWGLCICSAHVYVSCDINSGGGEYVCDRERERGQLLYK